MFSVADTLTLRVPWDYIGYMLMQCFRFEASFCLVVHPGKSTANNMGKHRSGPHRFQPFEVFRRSCFTSLHDYTIKEYYTVRARSQEINLWKCLFMYSFGLDSLFQGSLILCKGFSLCLFAFILFFFYCFLFYWLVWYFFGLGFFEKRKKEGRSRCLDRSIRTTLLLNGVNTDLLVQADNLWHKLTLCWWLCNVLCPCISCCTLRYNKASIHYQI